MKLNQSLAESNRDWFGRENAFAYLREDIDNQLRLTKVLELLSSNDREGKKLLDIGCGSGEIGKLIRDLGYKVYGIDVNPDLVNESSKKGVLAKTGDIAEGLPFKKAFFQTVFAGEVIEHLYDTGFFLKEVNRVLEIGGIFLLTTPNLVHLPDRFAFLRGRNPAQINPLHPFLKDHIRPFSFPRLKYCLDCYGFKVKDFVSTMVVFKRKQERVTLSSKLLASLFPELGSFLIIKAEKIKSNLK